MFSRPYAKAALWGLAVGVIAMVTVALQPWGGWQVPGWDNWWELDSRKMDLAHQAVFLRFCRLLVEQGFTYLAVPALIACAILKLEGLSQKCRLLHVTYCSFKLVVFFCVFYAVASVICAGYDCDVPAACETQLRNAWLEVLIRLGWLVCLALPTWILIAGIMWRFDKDWNMVPVGIGSEKTPPE